MVCACCDRESRRFDGIAQVIRLEERIRCIFPFLGDDDVEREDREDRRGIDDHVDCVADAAFIAENAQMFREDVQRFGRPRVEQDEGPILPQNATDVVQMRDRIRQRVENVRRQYRVEGRVVEGELLRHVMQIELRAGCGELALGDLEHGRRSVDACDAGAGALACDAGQELARSAAGIQDSRVPRNVREVLADDFRVQLDVGDEQVAQPVIRHGVEIPKQLFRKGHDSLRGGFAVTLYPICSMGVKRDSY